MPRRGGGGGGGGAEATGPILIVIIVIAAIGLAVYPIFPKVTATFQIKQSPEGVNFLSVKLDHLTFASAASIQKDVVFVYAVTPDVNGFAVKGVVSISYGGQTITTSPSFTLTTGLYSLSFVGNYRTEQPSIYYHVQVDITYPNGDVVSQGADVPPT